MSVKITGIKEVNAFFDKYTKKFDAVLSKELDDGGELILKESNNLAPKESGEMIRQTDVKKVSDTEYHVRYNTDYSLYVHEDMEKRHSNGQAKFLQEATNKKGKQVIKDIAKGIGNIKV